MYNNILLYKDDPQLHDITECDLYVHFADCIFQIKDCGKYTIRYWAEIFIRREISPENKKYLESMSVIMEIECLRDSNYLRMADNLMSLEELLPLDTFHIYEKRYLSRPKEESNKPPSNLEG